MNCSRPHDNLPRYIQLYLRWYQWILWHKCRLRGFCNPLRDLYKKSYFVAQMLRKWFSPMIAHWNHLGTLTKKFVALVPWELWYNWPSGRKFVKPPKGNSNMQSKLKKAVQTRLFMIHNSPPIASIFFKLFRTSTCGKITVVRDLNKCVCVGGVANKTSYKLLVFFRSIDVHKDNNPGNML